MITLSIGGLGYLKGKTPHCYHLVTIKSACRIAAFCGNRGPAGSSQPLTRLWKSPADVLDLFSWHAMLWP
jgi:hypothetical protein